LRKRKKRRRN